MRKMAIVLLAAALFASPFWSTTASANDVIFALPGGGQQVVQVDPRGPIRRALFPNRGRRINVAVNRGQQVVQIDPRGRIRRALFPNRGPRVRVAVNRGHRFVRVNSANVLVPVRTFHRVRPIAVAVPPTQSFQFFGSFPGVAVNVGRGVFVDVGRVRHRSCRF